MKAVGLEPTTYGLKVPNDDASCREVSQIDGDSSTNSTSANDTERQETAPSAQAGDKPDLSAILAMLEKLPQADGARLLAVWHRLPEEDKRAILEIAQRTQRGIGQ